MGLEGYLITCIGCLAGAITVLWRNDVSNHDRERLEWKEQVADLVLRIKTLEDSRLSAAIERGNEMKTLAVDMARELADLRSVLRGVHYAFDLFTKELRARPCMASFEPQPLTPSPDTTNTIKKEVP